MTAPKKTGHQTIDFNNPPVIISTASIVGPEEGAGPLASFFDKIIEDDHYGEKTWEKAERRMLEKAMNMSLQKAGMNPSQVDYMLAGDLLNQIISANYTAKALGIPFLGLYGACSTMYESMLLGAVLIDGGFAQYVLVGTGSHYATAERQHRFPVEQGVQKAMTAQRTVTGCAAMLLAAQGQGPRITRATVGKAIDLGQGDAMDMGSAMAPAAADTIAAHLSDTAADPSAFDMIITGDLGVYGKKLAQELLLQKGFDIRERFTDCGILIYSPDQDTHAGGSGCGCSAVVTCGHLVQQLNSGKFKRVLGIGTGALFSPLATGQGENIPGIAHAVVMETA
jgi:stage V sporulation protein AD